MRTRDLDHSRLSAREEKFLDIDEAASLTINTSKLKISKVAWVMVEKSAQGVVKIRERERERERERVSMKFLI